jgi:hypothetical protein
MNIFNYMQIIMKMKLHAENKTNILVPIIQQTSGNYDTERHKFIEKSVG